MIFKNRKSNLRSSNRTQKIIDLEPYQENAVQSVLDSKRRKDPSNHALRSGKTIVGQRIIERMESANIILILVPTLQLLNDTFEDYIKNTIWKTFLTFAWIQST